MFFMQNTVSSVSFLKSSSIRQFTEGFIGDRTTKFIPHGLSIFGGVNFKGKDCWQLADGFAKRPAELSLSSTTNVTTTIATVTQEFWEVHRGDKKSYEVQRDKISKVYARKRGVKDDVCFRARVYFVQQYNYWDIDLMINNDLILIDGFCKTYDHQQFLDLIDKTFLVHQFLVMINDFYIIQEKTLNDADESTFMLYPLDPIDFRKF